MKKIGFIGLGIMGKPMVKNLLKAGFISLLICIIKERDFLRQITKKPSNIIN